MLIKRIFLICLFFIPFVFDLSELSDIEKLVQKAKVEYLIEKNTPGAFISYDDFKDFVAENFITQTDENEFSDFKLKNLSFIRIGLKVNFHEL